MTRHDAGARLDPIGRIHAAPVDPRAWGGLEGMEALYPGSASIPRREGGAGGGVGIMTARGVAPGSLDAMLDRLDVGTVLLDERGAVAHGAAGGAMRPTGRWRRKRHPLPPRLRRANPVRP